MHDPNDIGGFIKCPEQIAGSHKMNFIGGQTDFFLYLWSGA